MRSADFDHVLRAAAEVVGRDEFVVIGSQAIHGSVPDPPGSLLVSLEVDIYPLHDPADIDRVDGSLGDGSQFHMAFGYYAHGVGPETAKAPSGWQERLVKREIPPRVASTQKPVAWCLELHDLVLSKCVRGEERDWEYATNMLEAKLVDPNTLVCRVGDLPVLAEFREHIASVLRAMATEPPTRGS